MSWTKCIGLCTVLVMLAVVAGCGADGDMGKVSGTVTLDGKPLEGATISFQFADDPNEEGGESAEGAGITSSPALGVTDSSGYYEVNTSANLEGAMVGLHAVTITHVDMDLPEEFESGSLTREVKGGKNVYDFDISSDGAAAPAEDAPAEE